MHLRSLGGGGGVFGVCVQAHRSVLPVHHTPFVPNTSTRTPHVLSSDLAVTSATAAASSSSPERVPWGGNAASAPAGIAGGSGRGHAGGRARLVACRCFRAAPLQRRAWPRCGRCAGGAAVCTGEARRRLALCVQPHSVWAPAARPARTLRSGGPRPRHVRSRLTSVAHQLTMAAGARIRSRERRGWSDPDPVGSRLVPPLLRR